MSPLWSYALAAIGIAGIWLAGRDKSIGWALGLFAQALWIAYALVTNQPGFIVSALAYGFVYARNWRNWRRSGR
jgi:nicotinamide riboside transporter PnuC